MAMKLKKGIKLLEEQAGDRDPVLLDYRSLRQYFRSDRCQCKRAMSDTVSGSARPASTSPSAMSGWSAFTGCPVALIDPDG